MRLDVALSPSERTTDYLERYVNDGSPSGFTLHDQLSSKTNPLGLEPYFHPYIAKPDASGRVAHFRSRRFDWPETYDALFAHPDAVSKLRNSGFECTRAAETRLVPTASGRTCRVLGDQQGYYLKLHFPGPLGRIDRALPDFKAIAGIEVSDEIATHIAGGNLPSTIAILPEVSATIGRPSDYPSASCVVRRRTAHPNLGTGEHARLPLFSLWSYDRLSPLDAPLLGQLSQMDPPAAIALVSETASALVDVFLSLWCSVGLLYEVNAQNVSLDVDVNARLVRLVLRDFNSTEKDELRRRELGLETDFVSGDYKIIRASDQGLAQRRRSFAFDFKLARYGIEPLVSAIDEYIPGQGVTVLSMLRDKVADAQARLLPERFFPADGRCWAHPEIDLQGERPYVAFSNPLLR